MSALSNNEIRDLIDRVTALEAEVQDLRVELGLAGHPASQHGADDSATDYSQAKTSPQQPFMTPTPNGGITGMCTLSLGIDLNGFLAEMMADPDVVGVEYRLMPVAK
ncbi:hypothetical protein FSARC_3446 [Fusarium sarcochroum]|uniref:Uncharacterized protein n=1 Tax=Fusarium sarcochroum TaxID=1208366 RepID=A0A8H4U3R1_9HYPO|nr:hypothetical protein FSARC_3446 [Fusarium sarcochroum]